MKPGPSKSSNGYGGEKATIEAIWTTAQSQIDDVEDAVRGIVFWAENGSPLFVVRTSVASVNCLDG